MQAGQWLKTNYPEQATVVATYVPGFWFSAFSDKTVIAETNPVVERNVISESILDLSYEIETPFTLLRAYEAKGDISSENYVSINNVWQLETYSSTAGDYISYNVGESLKKVELNQMTRHYTLDSSQETQKTLTIVYTNDDVSVTQTQIVQNTSYPTQVTWSITSINSPISNVTLYLSTFFNLYFNYDKATEGSLMENLGLTTAT